MLDFYSTIVFGQLTSGSDTNVVNNGARKMVTPCVLGGDSEITGLRFLSLEYKPNAKVKGVIYANNGGVPGDLLHVTDELVGVGVSLFGYLVFASPVNLLAGTYHLGFITDTSFKAAALLASGNHFYNTNAYVDGPSDPFGAATNWNYPLYIAAFLAVEKYAVAKATGFSVLSPLGAPVSKAVAYALLSTEISISVAKAVAYAVIVEGVEGGVQPVVFIIT